MVELNATGAVTAVNVFGSDGLVGRKTGAVNTFYAFDPQGNVSQVVDSAQNVVTALDYDAYGAYYYSGVPPNTPFLMNGKHGYYYDYENTLALCGYRYYSPGETRWLTRDPIGQSGGVNLYAYCQGRPVGNVDPTGTDAIGDWSKGMSDYLNGLLPPFRSGPDPDPAPEGVDGRGAGEPVHIYPDASPFPGNAVTPNRDTIWLPSTITPHDFMYSPDRDKIWWYNHEMGHIEQCRALPPLAYLPFIALGDLIGTLTGHPHDGSPMEIGADERADKAGSVRRPPQLK